MPGAPKRHKATIHVVPTCTAADKKDEVKDDQETKDKKIDDSVDGGADKDEIDGLVIEVGIYNTVYMSDVWLKFYLAPRKSFG